MLHHHRNHNYCSYNYTATGTYTADKTDRFGISDTSGSSDSSRIPGKFDNNSPGSNFQRKPLPSYEWLSGSPLYLMRGLSHTLM